MELGQFTWANLIALMSLLFVGLSSLLGVWWSIIQRIQGEAQKTKHEIKNVETTALAERNRIEKDLNAFKLHVVTEYASKDQVNQSHSRLEDRIETLSADVSKLPDVVVERMMRYMELKKNP